MARRHGKGCGGAKGAKGPRYIGGTRVRMHALDTLAVVLAYWRHCARVHPWHRLSHTDSATPTAPTAPLAARLRMLNPRQGTTYGGSSATAGASYARAAPTRRLGDASP